jgi:hypothetical protein
MNDDARSLIGGTNDNQNYPGLGIAPGNKGIAFSNAGNDLPVVDHDENMLMDTGPDYDDVFSDTFSAQDMVRR